MFFLKLIMYLNLLTSKVQIPLAAPRLPKVGNPFYRCGKAKRIHSELDNSDTGNMDILGRGWSSNKSGVLFCLLS